MEQLLRLLPPLHDRLLSSSSVWAIFAALPWPVRTFLNDFLLFATKIIVTKYNLGERASLYSDPFHNSVSWLEEAMLTP